MCCIQQEPSFLDSLVKVSTIAIGVTNIVIGLLLYKGKNKRDAIDKEKDRKLQLLKTLVLDYQLKYLYEFYEQIVVVTEELKDSSYSAEQKSHIVEGPIADLFIKLNKNFIDSFLAIDADLHKSIQNKIDELQSIISLNAIDNGINLSHPPKFDELIVRPIAYSKTDVLNIIYKYRG